MRVDSNREGTFQHYFLFPKWKEMGGEWGQSTEEEQAKDRWMPEVVVTPWGLTNDVVTLPNNKKYYFFRLPHKVNKMAPQGE